MQDYFFETYKESEWMSLHYNGENTRIFGFMNPIFEFEIYLEF
jgi:hypothetical protein